MVISLSKQFFSTNIYAIFVTTMEFFWGGGNMHFFVIPIPISNRQGYPKHRKQHTYPKKQTTAYSL